jgi:hypothetical protein
MAHGAPLRSHQHAVPGHHLLVFNFDGDHQITVTVLDEDMCRRQYVTPVVSSSSDDDEDDQQPWAT